MNKIKVVVSGIHYPVTMMEYFIWALKRRDDVELFTTGPFTGDWIPWEHGMTLSQEYVNTPNLPLPQQYIQQPGLPSSVIEARLPWKADLWLQIDAGWWLKNPKAGVVAHIATDPHVLNYDFQRKQSDYFFNMQSGYMKEGDIYLPYAYDPTIHKPLDLEKKYDGCLIGLHYPSRDELVQALRGAGYNIKYDMGIVHDEYNYVYNQSRVALNVSSLADLNARTFEAMGMRIPLLTNRIPALDDFFVEGEHYLGFGNLEEVIEKFMLLIHDPPFADYIADTAYALVSKEHTWDHRIQTILDTVFE